MQNDHTLRRHEVTSLFLFNANSSQYITNQNPKYLLLEYKLEVGSSFLMDKTSSYVQF